MNEQEQSGREQVRQEQDEQPWQRSADQRPADRKTAAAKARLVFRDPLDQQSRDDTDAGWGERSGAGESGGRGLDWYLSQRPPHHGD